MNPEQHSKSEAEPRPLRVLVVEDSEQDALLLELQLRQASWRASCKRVHTEKAMRAALMEGTWDLVISDYVLPGFGGLRALAILQEVGLDIPFIIVSGMIGEETAVAAMKAGAHDYLMKGNLARLIPAIDRELREAEMRQARRISEQRLRAEHNFRRTIENSIPSGLAVMDNNGMLTYVNPSFCGMVGWREEELLGERPPYPYWPPEEEEKLALAFAKMVKGQVPKEGFEVRFRRKDETRFDVLLLIAPLVDPSGRTAGWVLSVTDITQRKQAEGALRRAHDELEQRVRERTSELRKALGDLGAEAKERQKLADELIELADEQRVLNVIELHDDLGQRLAGMSLIIKSLENKLRSGQPIGATEVERISNLLSAALTGSDEASHPIERPTLSGQDLLSAMKGLVRFCERNHKLDCALEAKTALPILPQAVLVHLYRIALEAIRNAIKHGKATRIKVRLEHRNQDLILSITSNGKPFPDVAAGTSGVGLRIMNYRATLMNAGLEVGAGKRGGTVVTCKVPLGDSKI